jgi:cyclic pyranopterin phosphate synthase
MDKYGRKFSKLRLNLLDACNMRCLYCMPEDQTFSTLQETLSLNDIRRITEHLISSGIKEIRITGGEPLLHPNFKDIVKVLSKLKLEKLALTTNAIKLDKFLPFLKKTNLKYINISLDSLREASFQFITKSHQFHKVLENILLAKASGFKVKLNMVMMKNLNFEEIEDFLAFSAINGIEVRFLEMMKVGHALTSYSRHFVSADEAIERLSKSWKFESIEMPKDSTSFNFIAHKDSLKAQVGFIASESKPFCTDCSRLRLTNRGELRPCMMINEGPNVMDLTQEEMSITLDQLLDKKPNFRIDKNILTMNEIGG